MCAAVEVMRSAGSSQASWSVIMVTCLLIVCSVCDVAGLEAASGRAMLHQFDVVQCRVEGVVPAHYSSYLTWQPATSSMLLNYCITTSNGIKLYQTSLPYAGPVCVCVCT